MSSSRPLFGGAITSTIPSDLIDASDLRQVPDTQEVFLSPDSDLSLIVEVLELVTEGGAGESVEGAIKFHYSSLAHDNTALSSTTSSITLPTPTASDSSLVIGPTTLTGTQVISKFNKGPEDADTVLILLALWRIPSKQADLTLSVNFPLKKAGEEGEASGEDATRVFEEAVRSLRIEDLGLFAGGQ